MLSKIRQKLQNTKTPHQRTGANTSKVNPARQPAHMHISTKPTKYDSDESGSSNDITSPDAGYDNGGCDDAGD